jgi:hypothetical protein
MKSWLIMMGGLMLWAVHFFLLYLLAEFGGGASGVRMASLCTLAILGAAVWLFVAVVRDIPQDPFARWRRRAGLLALAFGGFGIVLQYLPVVLIDR